MTPWRLADRSSAEQHSAFRKIVQASPTLMTTLKIARVMDLPDWWLVSGALYGQVWNHLTGRPDMHGVKDLDLFYFDPDTRWEAEDRVIQRAKALFAPVPPVEIRNQARVPLWYPQHFGRPYPPIQTCCQAIDRFAARTHCVAVRLEPDDTLAVYAPFGLDDIFALRLVPNPVMDNRATYAEKARRQQGHWPELTVVPWPD